MNEIKSIANNILHYHFEQSPDLEDILESLQDYGLLTNKGEEVRKEIWEITTKGLDGLKTEENTYEDVLMRTRKTLSKDQQKYLIREAKEGMMNKRAIAFMKKNGLYK